MVTLASGDPRSPEARRLIDMAAVFSAQLYPPTSIHRLGADALLAPQIRFWLARDGEAAIGTAALVLKSDGWGEVKSLFVDPAYRARGTGGALMQAIEAEARANALTVLRLETGTLNTAAIRLYRTLGFTERAPFDGYDDDPLSVFMEKSLAA